MKSIIYIIIICCVLIGCGGGGAGGETITTTLNVPTLPEPPVSRLVLPNEYVSFFIGTVPLGTNKQLATSQQFTQQLYTIDADYTITPVSFLDPAGVALDLTGNVSFADEEKVIPLDILVMSPDYVMLTLFHRNFDTDTDNDYFNLLIDLRSGNVTNSPLGLNAQSNSGQGISAQFGRDFFPPDSRWNDTDDLFVISIDYEALDMIEEVDHVEIVDHHTGVPCPVNETDDTTDEPVEEDPNAAPVEDPVNDPADPNAQDTTEEDTQVICTEPIGGTITPTPITNAPADPADPAAVAAFTTGAAVFSHAQAATEPPTPTNIYRMRLGAANQYTLEQVSLEDDRPGLGQFIVSRSGIMIYRNLDGGDNSYRVLLEDCEDVTGRLSTVLLAPYSTLLVADDDAGNSSIFEVTERGVNKLIFSCNGNIIRQSFSGYTTRINSLRLPYNSESISSYDYLYPYFINTSCQGGRMFPRQNPEIQIFNPIPSTPGVPSGDVRGLRKSQVFNNNLYCLGYTAGLDLTVAQLDTTGSDSSFEFLNIDFGLWLPDFDTLHMLSSDHVVFTGTSRVSTETKTIMLNTAGEEFDLTEAIVGLKINQQIEIIPPTGPYASSLVEE